MKRKQIFGKLTKRAVVSFLSCLISMGMVLSGCSNANDVGTDKESKSEQTKEGKGGNDNPEGDGVLVNVLSRKLIRTDYEIGRQDYVPSVKAYQANSDLSNVQNADRFYFNDEIRRKLSQNNFVVSESQYAEFFEIYESNRYMQYPSFITTDSMMHTYHLYFAMLQENTEKEYLIGSIERLTTNALAIAKGQYDSLKGTEWEEAAKLNLAYFGVASKLLGLNNEIPAEVSGTVSEETGKIMSASGIEMNALTEDYEDYSQYKPRGYYDGNERLEKYFRTMIWYGRMNFAQAFENMNRCALLMTLILRDDSCYNDWDAVYEVTSFFVGQSDDLGFYEYMPAIEKAYGMDVSAEKLAGDQKAWEKYVESIKTLRAPEINSVVFADDDGETDKTEAAKGFRFMGQRFTMDAAVFTQLCYSKVKEAKDGSKRMLPDALDVPAAMGSDLALELLKQTGVEKYPNYLENLESARKKIANANDYWTSSLYGGWLYTLNPLLDVKGEGYPSFMTNKEWQKKSLEGYLGSWTELKHDTVLYAKQMMAEMGGDDWETYDDRGYVEPEPELYARLRALTATTSEGLGRLGVIRNEDKEGLALLGDLASRLQEISIKELQNEKLTESDYDFIRTYGGALEHLWDDVIKNKTDSPYYDSSEFPMALVTDVATDPNGLCLQEAIGGASSIYVIFPIDGELHVGIGGVFNYYQFTQPISDRLTDKEWRIMLGVQLDDNYEYRPQKGIKGPDWTDSYRYRWSYGY